MDSKPFIALASVGFILSCSPVVFSQETTDIEFFDTLEEGCSVINLVNGALSSNDDASSLSSTSPGGASGSFEVSSSCTNLSIDAFSSELPNKVNAVDISASINIPGVGVVSDVDGNVDITSRSGDSFSIDIEIASLDGSSLPSGNYSAVISATLTAN